MLLRTYWHHEEGVVGETNEREEHEAKKDVEICSFCQVHVAESHEEGSQAEKDESHRIKMSPEGHKCNHYCPKAKNAKHAIHLNTPLCE